MPITIAQLDAHSKPYFSKDFTDNVYKQCVLWDLLRRRKRIIGGTEARFPIDIKKLDTGGFVNPDDQIPLGGRDTDTALVFAWAFASAQTQVGWREKVTNVGDAVIVDTVARKAMQLRDELADKLGAALYTKQAAGLNPLSDLIGTGALGGVDEAVFRSTVSVLSGGQAAQTLYFWANDKQGISWHINKATFGKRKPTHMFCTIQNQSDLEATWVEQTGRTQIPQSKETIELGLPAMMFKGVDIMGDQYMDDANLDGTFYGIDLNGLLCIESREGTTNGEWVKGTIAGFPHSFYRIATWTGQLGCTIRRTMYRISGVTGFGFKK